MYAAALHSSAASPMQVPFARVHDCVGGGLIGLMGWARLLAQGTNARLAIGSPTGVGWDRRM